MFCAPDFLSHHIMAVKKYFKDSSNCSLVPFVLWPICGTSDTTAIGRVSHLEVTFSNIILILLIRHFGTLV